MYWRSRLLLVTLGAVFVLSAAVSSAEATRLEILFSNRGFILVWTLLEFVMPGAGTVRCPLTMEGTFHKNTFTKVSGTLLGYVQRATAASSLQCTEGFVTPLLTSFPWHLRYSSFQGALPAITEVKLQIINMGIGIRLLTNPQCLFRTTEANPLNLNGHVTEEGMGLRWIFEVNEEGAIPLTGGAFCSLVMGGAGRLSGAGNMIYAAPGAGVRVKIKLI